MHINSNRLGEQFTSVEQTHLESCQQCTFEQEAIIQLKTSVDQIKQLHPPQSDWLVIQQRMVKKQQVKRTSFMPLFIRAAASIFFIAVGWLAWSNYHLQGQLEQVLLLNQSLELQLTHEIPPSFTQFQLLKEVGAIENKLAEADSDKEKLKLLIQRNYLMKTIAQEQGSKHEIFI